MRDLSRRGRIVEGRSTFLGLILSTRRWSQERRRGVKLQGIDTARSGANSKASEGTGRLTNDQEGGCLFLQAVLNDMFAGLLTLVT
jgi:hypothetical protein